MRTRIATIGAALAMLALTAGPAWADWAPIGGPVDPSGVNNGRPSAATVGGVPYAAWIRGNDLASSRIQVGRLNQAGTGWDSLGGPTLLPSSPGDYQGFPSLVSFGGAPYVAFTEFESGESQVRVARLNSGGAWEQVGQTVSHSDGEYASLPSLAVVGSELWLAWEETTAGIHTSRRVYAARLVNLNTSPVWAEVSGPLNADPGQDASAPRIAGVNGVAYAAWREYANGRDQIRAARYNAAANVWGIFTAPIVHNPADQTSSPAIAGVAGVPYVTWNEAGSSGPGNEVWVARVAAAGNQWEIVAGSPSGPSAQAVDLPDIAGIGGAPYVTWTNDLAPEHHQVLVARLNAARAEWEQVGSPLESAAGSDSGGPRLTVANGVPWTFWFEGANAPPGVTHAAVLQPDFLAQTAFASDTGAMLATRLRTLGFPYDVGFSYGEGSGLGSATPATTTTDGAQVDTIFQVVGNLKPATAFSFAPFAGYGFPHTALGPLGQFTTKAVSGPGPQGPPGSPGSSQPVVAPATKVRLSCPVTRTRRAARRRACTLRFVSVGKAKVSGRLTRGKRLYASGGGPATPGPITLKLPEKRALAARVYTLTIRFRHSKRLSSVLVLRVRVR